MEDEEETYSNREERRMRSVQEIDQELEVLRSRLTTVQGTETEIYTRIVGYYRSLKNWNKGKREEYDHRRTFDAGDQARVDQARQEQVREEQTRVDPARRGDGPSGHTGTTSATSPAHFTHSAAATAVAVTAVETPAETGANNATYQYFYRNGCSGCGPVRQKLEMTGLSGIAYDVDTDEGFAMAAANEIMATPTVIFYAPGGTVLGRATAVQEIDAILGA
jgi:ribonucleoside-triphosphate reductase